jgi:O-antigen/teichoic acid export membrane protein
MKQFALRVQQGKKLTRASLLYTAAVGGPVVAGVVVLALIAHPLFRTIFGHRWEGAADYAVVLAGWAAIRLASLPMATLTTVLRVQKMSFWIDAVFAARVAIIPVMAAHHAGALMAVGAFCALSVLYHLIVVALGLVVALRYDRSLVPQAQSFIRAGEIHV